MGTKQVRISNELYERVKALNREGETFGETLERLVTDYSLTEFADDVADVHSFDPDAFEQQLEEDDEENVAELEEQLNLE
jgi:predicted CopG family antitoxin